MLRQGESGQELVLGRRGRDSVTWSLPKGTPDGDETMEQTALREVEEETGLQVRIVAPVGPIDYFFVQKGIRIHKTVHYYLMEPVGGDLTLHDHEFDEVRWVSLDDARGLMSFPTERELVARALATSALATSSPATSSPATSSPATSSPAPSSPAPSSLTTRATPLVGDA